MSIENTLLALANVERAKDLLQGRAGGKFKASLELNADNTWTATVNAATFTGNTVGEAIRLALESLRTDVQAIRQQVKDALDQAKDLLGGGA